jgi:predicted pyridoxine 5'-phosphate oxidase superfamily flavin-nucleotide-binding protein
MRTRFKAGLVLLALPLLLGADVYRWVDENGVVNYTQLKPEGVDAVRVSAATGQRVTAPVPPPADASAAPGTARAPDPEQLTEDQQKMLADLEAAEQARQQEVARIRQANCAQARELLERLTARGRIRVRGDDGVDRVLPEEERQQRIAEAQRAIAVNCSNTASR